MYTKEAEYWHRLKNNVATNVDNALMKRLNSLERMYLTSDPAHDKISESIRNNSFYRVQLAMH